MLEWKVDLRQATMWCLLMAGGWNLRVSEARGSRGFPKPSRSGAGKPILWFLPIFLETPWNTQVCLLSVSQMMRPIRIITPRCSLHDQYSSTYPSSWPNNSSSQQLISTHKGSSMLAYNWWMTLPNKSFNCVTWCFLFYPGEPTPQTRTNWIVYP